MAKHNQRAGREYTHSSEDHVEGEGHIEAEGIVVEDTDDKEEGNEHEVALHWNVRGFTAKARHKQPTLHCYEQELQERDDVARPWVLPEGNDNNDRGEDEIGGGWRGEGRRMYVVH